VAGWLDAVSVESIDYRIFSDVRAIIQFWTGSVTIALPRNCISFNGHRVSVTHLRMPESADAVTIILISYSLRTISSFWAYWACNLESLVFEFGSELRSIELGCIKTWIVSLFLPRTLRFLGYNIYRDYSSITCVHFGRQSSIARLARNIFLGLYYLFAITIPSSVKRIDRNAFRSCFSLRSVHFELSLYVGVFALCHSTLIIHDSNQSLSLHQSNSSIAKISVQCTIVSHLLQTVATFWFAVIVLCGLTTEN
jgi:hypothetical protein